MQNESRIQPDIRIETEKPEKQYLYHMVPENMEGTMLHPLNRLKDSAPHLYLAHAEKYQDRSHIMEKFIPTLECAWSDVLHFTAVHPAEIKKALTEAGLQPAEMKFYQIDPRLLDPEQTTIYLYRDASTGTDISEQDFTGFNPNDLDSHASLPNHTKDYYKRMASEGKRPLTFIGVPHILHKGSIDISDLPIITV